MIIETEKGKVEKLRRHSPMMTIVYVLCMSRRWSLYLIRHQILISFNFKPIYGVDLDFANSNNHTDRSHVTGGIREAQK